MSRDDEGFLARWSRRKSEARAVPETPAAAPEGPAAAPVPAAPAPSAAAGAVAPQPEPLPPLESLTPHSDFSAFMKPEVDPSVKGQALKTLFSDSALYPMDGLDVYIDDYSKPDPLPEGWLAKLNQLATLHGEPAAGPAAEGEGAAPEAGADRAAEPPAPAAEARSDTSATPDAEHESDNRSTT